MVQNSHLIYHLKFIEDKETMFNPKLSTNKNTCLLSSFLKKIKEEKQADYIDPNDEITSNLNNTNLKENKDKIENNYFQKSSSSKKYYSTMRKR